MRARIPGRQRALAQVAHTHATRNGVFVCADGNREQRRAIAHAKRQRCKRKTQDKR